MKLINGPYNNREIADIGTVTKRMAIYQTGQPVIGQLCGSAYYEPSEDRTLAFWSHNEWEGTLEGHFPASDWLS